MCLTSKHEFESLILRALNQVVNRNFRHIEIDLAKTFYNILVLEQNMQKYLLRSCNQCSVFH